MTTPRPISKIRNIGQLERLYEQSIPGNWRDTQEALAAREQIDGADAKRADESAAVIADKYTALKNNGA